MCWIQKARQAGTVSRFHTKPLLFNQDISQHSFNCTFIAMELCNNVEDVDSNKIIKYVLCHDLAEVFSGDASGEAKKYHPELKEVLDKIEQQWFNEHLPDYLKDVFDLNPQEKLIAKCADILEGLQTALIDVRLGNTLLESAVRDLYHTLIDKVVDIEVQGYDNLEENLAKILCWIDREYDKELTKCLGED